MDWLTSLAEGSGALVVTDEQVAALRAFLVDDQKEFDRLAKRLDRTSAWFGYSALLSSTFFEAVTRRFAPTWTAADIVRFVATVRAQYIEDPDELDPQHAERLIRTALGDGSVEDLDNEIKAAQVILLPALVDEERPGAADLEEILALARERADCLPL
jgi:hypothetical protein